MDLFDLTTVQKIVCIHIPRIFSSDKWVWVPSPLEQFSMKYAREISIAQRGCVSPFTVDNWKSLWGFKLQARLKYLLWKITWICYLHVQILIDLSSLRIWMLGFVRFVRILLKPYLTFSWNVI
jgi:hypothetical protein